MKVLVTAVALVIISSVSVFAQSACERHFEPAGGFSYCPPVGWTSLRDPDAKYYKFLAPQPSSSGSYVSKFKVDELPRAEIPLELFMTGKLRTTPAGSNKRVLQKTRSTGLVTAAKVKGVRVEWQEEVKGERSRFIWYILQGKDRIKIQFHAMVPENDVETPKLLDAMIQTFRFDN